MVEDLALETIKKYLKNFSNKDSIACSSYWQYPSALICDKQSSKFFSSAVECSQYYRNLFFALSLMKYKQTEIIELKATKINEDFCNVDLKAQRIDINSIVIKKLKCIYILNYDNKKEQTYIRGAFCV